MIGQIFFKHSLSDPQWKRAFFDLFNSRGNLGLVLTNSTHDSSGFFDSKRERSFKMATSTDMKGNVVKMEVDYSDTVDKRIPECEKLATVSNLRFHLIFCNWGYSF